ncbi:MAG: VCBS repeat-containing protein, partial [Saprospiraceae bacterium]|nr:VCBS repeat-containing protein [Saprospiraceae bacterium]
GDGRPDLYLGGAKGQPGSLLLQDATGNFVPAQQELWETDRTSEDVDCRFFDADGDGRPDLYVVSGGNEFSRSSDALF